MHAWMNVEDRDRYRWSMVWYTRGAGVVRGGDGVGGEGTGRDGTAGGEEKSRDETRIARMSSRQTTQCQHPKREERGKEKGE